MARKKNIVLAVGTLTKKQVMNNERKISREIEIEADPSKGFKSTHKVHKSDKTYKRKDKHAGQRGY